MRNYLLIGIAASVAIASCMTLDKATNKVLADPGAKEKVGREWEKQNPCSNDTAFLVKRDTTVTEHTEYLPGAVTTRNDTVYKTDTVRVTKKVVIHDTVKYYVTDNRRVFLAEDSVRQYKVWLDTERAKTAALNAEHNQVSTMLKYAGLALLKKWWFWAILLAAGGVWYLNKKAGLLSIFKLK